MRLGSLPGWPLLMDERSAAAFVSAGVRDFRAAVAAGALPGHRTIHPQLGALWHRLELEAAAARAWGLDRLPVAASATTACDGEAGGWISSMWVIPTRSVSDAPSLPGDSREGMPGRCRGPAPAGDQTLPTAALRLQPAGWPGNAPPGTAQLWLQ